MYWKFLLADLILHLGKLNKGPRVVLGYFIFRF